MEMQRITIVDGQSTPVSHDFDPQQRSSNKATYVEFDPEGSLLGRNTLHITSKPLGQGGRSTQEVELELYIPNVVTETVNGVDREKILDSDRVIIRHIAGSSSTMQRRKDIRTLALNLLQNADVLSMIDNAESITG